MKVKSLDPRVQRLPEINENSAEKKPLDQLVTFEVFVQPKQGKPFQHEGAIHAPNLEMAFILAKENLTRRFTCVSLWVADTADVVVSQTTEGNQNVYDLINSGDNTTGSPESFEIFHLPKRGKQHVHFRTVDAATANDAMALAKNFVQPGGIFFNIWAIRSKDIRKTTAEENDLWITLPEKKFRDASAYKGGDKLKEFLERNQSQKE